ncbi:uncharacterized protein LOC135090396 [Scylla paramamosain]|uniref:uncharacterized protein LOC135090396 n=1 Tax=Scylla paramamosain TaxID=85552 RepID=UPI0030826EBD
MSVKPLPASPSLPQPLPAPPSILQFPPASLSHLNTPLSLSKPLTFVLTSPSFSQPPTVAPSLSQPPRAFPSLLQPLPTSSSRPSLLKTSLDLSQPPTVTPSLSQPLPASFSLPSLLLLSPRHLNSLSQLFQSPQDFPHPNRPLVSPSLPQPPLVSYLSLTQTSLSLSQGLQASPQPPTASLSILYLPQPCQSTHRPRE